jgi:hypothetical protein
MTTIESLEDANDAVLNRGEVLRIQPPAPGATTYFTVTEQGWSTRKAGHEHWRSVDVDAVRTAVKRAIARNKQSSVDVCRAVTRGDLW